MSRVKNVLLVGHCGPDSWMLKSKVSQVLPDAQVEMVNDEKALADYDASETLWLVNRVLDGSFNASDGIDLIRKANQQGDPVASLLISNYEDAQSDAEAAGALPGFGKAELGASETEDKLKKAAGYAD